MHVGIKKLFHQVKKSQRLLLFLLLALFLLISNQAEALKFTKYYTQDEATVKTSPISLAAGNSSACSISPTSDYASVTATSGLTFIENADLLVPTQATSPSLDGSNIAQFTSATSGSCSFTTTTANDVIYVAVSILGTSATSSVTNSSGSSLTLRGAITNSAGVRCETWYKIATSTGTQTVNVSFASATTFAIIAFGVKDANLPNPFDVTSGNPVTATGTGVTQAVTAGSIIANTLVFGSVAIMDSVTPNVGSGFTSVQRSNNGGLGEGVEYEELVTTDNTTIIFTTGASSVSWAMVGDVIWGKLPSLSVDTGFSTPASGGSQVINTKKEGYLVSPAYPRETTIYEGWWQLNLWVESQKANEEMDLMLVVTDSSYNILNDVCSRYGTGYISDSPSLVTVNCDQPQVTVPAGGHLVLLISNLKGASNTFTVYWGTQGSTNLKTTQVSDYVLRIVNAGSSTYGVSFSAYSSSSITKMSNLTLYAYTPTNSCIAITNGAFTQSSSGLLALSGSSTLYLAINATATDFNTVASIVVMMKFNSTRPCICYFMNLTLN